MPRRRSSLRAGWLKLGVMLALPLVSTAAAACPLCYQAARQMMTEGVQLDVADRAVLAARDREGGPLKIVAVVKGSDHVGDVVSDPVTYPVTDATGAVEPGQPSLLLRDPTGPQWTSLGAIPLSDADWLRELAATHDIPGDRRKRTWPLTTATADALSNEGWRQRVALVLPYLENANPLASRLASGELARAPYAALDVARSRVDPATVEAWIDNPKLAAQRATYLTLLGFVGRPEDAARLDRLIDASLASHDPKDLAAAIAADVQLGGQARIDMIEARFFRERGRSMPEIEAALLALNVLGDSGSPELRARVVRAYEELIKARPAMAGFVAPQLADWDCWEVVSSYAAILKSLPDMDPASQFAIVNYLKRAAAAGVAIQ
jgi:hypothetical protein